MNRSQLLGAILSILALAGCAGQPVMQPIKVAVPVPCRVDVPPRPAMPTEALTPADAVDLDKVQKHLQAEIEIREGYEGVLRTALAGCMAPLPKAPAAAPAAAAPADL